jgi:hypothetical protein
MKRTFLLFAILGLMTTFFIQPAEAIPAFARKYRLSCKTCHSPFPRLKPYGEEFASNGFVLPDSPATRYYVDTGDDQLTLIRDLPWAFRLEGFISYNKGDSSKLDFTSPYLLKFLSGGELFPNVSYYFYFFMNERGDVAGLEDAFMMFSNVMGSGIDVTLGQFQVSDPLFKRELRLTYEDYWIYKVRTGESESNLTYDRGVMFSYGTKTGMDIILEVLNGNGIDPADEYHNYDTDKNKNYMLRISQSIGKHFRMGAFGYSGKEDQTIWQNKITMAGIDTSLSFDNYTLNVQYLTRTDDNPYFVIDPARDIDTTGGFAELVYLPNGHDSKWYLVGLYNWVDSDQDDLDYTSATLHYGYMLRRNFRLTAEMSYLYDGPYEDHMRVVLGFVSAF